MVPRGLPTRTVGPAKLLLGLIGMPLMMTTQCLNRNHPIQGFVHRWYEVLGGRADRLYVVANEVQPHDLPASVSVHSPGQEDGAGRFRKHPVC